MERIGKYQILELIGRGGMGSVYRARDTVLDRLVAVKVMSPDVEATEEVTARFFDEAKACAVLSHPSIVTIYDVGEDNGRLYIVMELLDGFTLKNMIAERTGLSLQEKVAAMIRLCDALSYAHEKGVIHRDIKPANILFQRVGPPKIIDFGIAKMASSTSLTRTGLIMGTLRYMPPEQVRGRADKSSDQYSIAAVFYELLSLRPPFEGDDPIQLLELLRAEQPPRLVELDPAIPPELAAVIERGMSKLSEDRYADMRAMAAALESVERKLAEEARRIHHELGPLIEEVRSLDVALARKLGGPTGLQLPVLPDAPWVLDTLRTRKEETLSAAEALRDRARTVDRLEPRLREARELAHAGRFADAKAALDAVVEEAPEFAAALAVRKEVAEAEEAARRLERARELLASARNSLEAEDPDACMALLREASEVPAPAEVAEDIATLTGLAKKVADKLAAKRRVQHQAEQDRDEMRAASEEAQSAAAAQNAPEAWKTAESGSKEALALFAAAKYSEASFVFERATEAFRSATKLAREAADKRRREQEASELAARATKADALLDRARAAISDSDYPRSLELLREVEKLPPPPRQLAELTKLLHDVETTVENERRSRKPAQQARMVMIRARGDAEKEGAAKSASATWAEAEAKAASGTVAFQRESFKDAHDAFVAATAGYQKAGQEARAAKSGTPPVGKEGQRAPTSGTADKGGAAARETPRETDDDTRTALHVAPTAPSVPVKGRVDSADAEADDRTMYASPASPRPPVAGSAAGGGSGAKTPQPDSDVTVFRAPPSRDGGSGKAASRPAAQGSGTDSASVAGERHATPLQLRHLAIGGAVLAVLVVGGLLLSRPGTPPVEAPAPAAPASVVETAPPVAPAPPPVASAPPPVASAPPVASSAPVVPPVPGTEAPAAGQAGGDADVRARFAAAEAMQQEALQASKAGDYARAEKLYASAREAFNSIAGPGSAPQAADAKSPTDRQAAARADAEEAARFKAETDAKAAADVAARVRADAEARGKVDAAAKAKTDADAKAKADADARAKADATAKLKAEAETKARADAAARTKAEAEARTKADAEAKVKAAEAKEKADAKASVQAKADADAKLKAAAKTKADLEAKKEAEAKAAAKAKKDAEQLAAAKADAAAKERELKASNTVLAVSNASVFTEPTDGKKGGGAWGACWRVDPGAARTCARTSCDKTRNSKNACVETASSARGGHCAVARASGFGVSWGACGMSSGEATAAALAGCAQQVKRAYGESTKCAVVWSTDRPK